MRRAIPIVLTDDERSHLTTGAENQTITAELGVAIGTVRTWRNRFASERLPGIEHEKPGRGRKGTKRRHWARTIVDVTLHTTPANATHWSQRMLANHLGIDKSMVERVWKQHKLQPHRVKTFKLSRDKQFVEKLIDVVGLYLRPPEHGTTTLFAALEVASGRVISDCQPRLRHQEFVKFLRLLDQQTPRDLALHLILDNYATHKHPAVHRWLKRHPRFHLHFTPTPSSWPNLIERWFPRDHRQTHPPRRLPQRQGPRRGHRGLHGRAQREPALVRLDREAETILEKIRRARATRWIRCRQRD